MSKFLYAALILSLVSLLACSGEDPTLAPTATSIPASPPTATPSPTATPPPTVTPPSTVTPLSTVTPPPTATPGPTPAPPSLVATGEIITPLSPATPSAFVSELSQVELDCILEIGDAQSLLTALQSPNLPSTEVIEELNLCLKDETLLRLFLTGLSSPLSGESSACIRAGFSGFDIRSILMPQPTEEDESKVMEISMAAFFLATLCLNEADWAVTAPRIGMDDSDRETLQCLMSELGGPQGAAAALQPADGGPLLAFYAASAECGMATPELTSLPDPTSTAPQNAGIAPFDPNNGVAFMSELSSSEQSCISENADVPQLATGIISFEDAQSVMQCFEDETLLRLFLTQITSQTGTLSPQSSACIRSGFAGIDLRSATLAGDDEQGDAMVDAIGMAGELTALSCLDEQEYLAVSAIFGIGPQERENLQCAMDTLGGAEGIAATLQAGWQSGDARALVAIRAAAYGCGLDMVPPSGR